MRRRDGLLIRTQRPLDVILWQSVSEHGAGMIEDHAIRFAVRRTQAATDHLAE
jgi:hypothetical protein